MDKRFLTAFSAPDKWEIMGFELKPFSTRHLIALHAVNSPFVTYDRLPEPFETIAFLRICSMKKASYDVRAGFLDSLFAYRLHRNAVLHVQICKAIGLYVNEYCSSPKVVSRGIRKKAHERKSNLSDLPTALTTLTMAISKLGMTESEALDAPFGRLAWYSVCFSMLEGNDEVRLITTALEEKAEDDRQSILRHEADVEERLRRAMANGKIKKQRIVRTSS